VNMVMNVWVPSKEKIFFTSLATVGLSRTLLYGVSCKWCYVPGHLRKESQGLVGWDDPIDVKEQRRVRG